MPEKQPEHSRRQCSCLGAPCPSPILRALLGEQPTQLPHALHASPGLQHTQLLHCTDPCSIAPRCKHPKCGTDTAEELLRGALALFQLAQADPASLPPGSPFLYHQPLCGAALCCYKAAASH